MELVGPADRAVASLGSLLGATDPETIRLNEKNHVEDLRELISKGLEAGYWLGSDWKVAVWVSQEAVKID